MDPFTMHLFLLSRRHFLYFTAHPFRYWFYSIAKHHHSLCRQHQHRTSSRTARPRGVHNCSRLPPDRRYLHHAFLFRRRGHDRHSHQGNTDKLYRGFNQYGTLEPRYQLVLQPIWAPEYGTERQLTYGEAPSVLDQINNYLFGAGRIGLTVFEVVTYSTRGRLVVIARGFMREAQTLPLPHAIPRDRRYH